MVFVRGKLVLELGTLVNRPYRKEIPTEKLERENSFFFNSGLNFRLWSKRYVFG